MVAPLPDSTRRLPEDLSPVLPANRACLSAMLQVVVESTVHYASLKSVDEGVLVVNRNVHFVAVDVCRPNTERRFNQSSSYLRLKKRSGTTQIHTLTLKLV